VRGRETELLDRLGIAWQGGNPHILCPYPGHDDHEPSWRWDRQRCRAYCTCIGGERKSHSIFDVVMGMESLDFKEACLRIAELLGANDIIKTRRGADFPGCRLSEYAEAKKLPLTHLRELGLREIRLSGVPVVVIPYLDPDGQEIATRFRVGLNGRPRFKWKKGSRTSLYGLHRLSDARSAGRVVLCEGESDCHTCWHHNIPALGLCGNTQWNEQRDAPYVVDIERIYAVVEPGNSGAVMQRRLARSPIQPRLKLVRFNDEVKDISALHLADPESFPAAFEAMLEHAEPCPPYRQPTPTEAVDDFLKEITGAPRDEFDGLYYREFGPFSIDDETGLTYTPDDADKPPLWLAAAFEVIGGLRDHRGNAWGLLLRWRDRDGRRHEWVMPLRLVARRQEEVLEPLLDGGLKISPVPAARQRLVEYLGSVEADRRLRVTAIAGWLANSSFFVPAVGTEPDNGRRYDDDH
jgi:hypothetical protein